MLQGGGPNFKSSLHRYFPTALSLTQMNIDAPHSSTTTFPQSTTSNPPPSLHPPSALDDNSSNLTPFLYRQHITQGCLVIREMGEIASNSNLYDALAECEVVRTALTMFQRFYWKHRMQSNCIWEVALASIILSSKASERPLPLRTCILLLHRVWLVRVNHGSPAPLPTTTLKPHDEHYLRWKARAIEVRKTGGSEATTTY